MRIRVRPGRGIEGRAAVPGDKSIAHRWLIFASTAAGRSRLVGLPPSLDVRSTAVCLASLAGRGRPTLEAWARNGAPGAEGHRSTWNGPLADGPAPAVEVEGEGRSALVQPAGALDCGNSATTMRLLAGIVAAAPFRTVLTGDASLSGRPMERVAEPLRSMGAGVRTTDGHAPLTVDGRSLRGIRHELLTPSAQVKSAVILAGLAASGPTTVREPIATRDHTERAIAALGGPIERRGLEVTIEPFQHAGFEATVPGDPSSAAFLIVAAAVTGGELTIGGVSLNPTRLAFLDVLARMGVRTRVDVQGQELGEPVGSIHVAGGPALVGTTIAAEELPLVIDEVPALAAAAASARGETRFLGASELRVKESDRLSGVASGIAGLGGHAGVEGAGLVVAGGGLRGGRAGSQGDHRLAMAFAVAAAGADAPCTIEGAEAAAVSFPGFVDALRSLGADVEAER